MRPARRRRLVDEVRADWKVSIRRACATATGGKICVLTACFGKSRTPISLSPGQAIAEAATRPTMRFEPIKSDVQSEIQALHRARSRLVAERTALLNHLRALLLERGIVVAQGRRKLEDALGVFADEDGPRLSPRIRVLIEDLRTEWRSLDERIAAFDAELAQMAREDEAAHPLWTIPCIGVINATALTAAVGDARSFGCGRDLAAWLGLTPRQATTGGKPRLLGIQARQPLPASELDPSRSPGDAAWPMGTKPVSAGA